MAIYIRIDRQQDLDWLERAITNWLSANPNNPTLISNYEFIKNWDEYIKNPLTTKQFMDEVGTDAAKTILPDEVVNKLKAKEAVKASPKTPGRKPSAKTLAKRKAKERAERAKEIASDPYRCSDHLTYQGKYRPRTDCSRCWKIYETFHPLEAKKAYADFQRKMKKGSADA